jgi:DNA-binding response OmpR family regulator
MPDHDIKPVVLVVDDDEVIRMVHEKVLTLAGFSVRTAEDAKSALAQLSRARPQAVLLDMAMPGASGLAVIEAIRARTEQTHIPIIAVTGMASDADFWQGEEWGWDRYMQKPVKPEDLVAAIHEEIEKAARAAKRPRKKS